MPGNLWTYSPSDIKVLIGGIYPVEGYIDGAFVAVTKDIMPFSSERASDGSVGRVYHRNDDYTITLRLMAQSPSNDVLTKLWQLDELTQRGKFPLLIRDTLGTSFFHSTTTWIKDIPALSYDNQGPERVWVLQSSQGVINVGGNDDPATALETLNNILTGALPSLEGVV